VIVDPLERPTPAPLLAEPRADALATQLAQLGQTLTAQQNALTQLAAGLARLEQAPPATASAAVDLAPLEQRLAALEQHPAPAGPSNDDLARLAARVEQASAGEQALESRLSGAQTQFAAQLADLQTRLAQAQSLSEQLGSLSDRAGKMAHVQAARAALEAGRPLGALPGALASLARFAGAAPPTEAALRLSFPKLAQAAQDAARPAETDADFWQRVWLRVQQQITLRQGTRVIVGNPAAGVLALAQSSLDAGDLAGAVAALRGLPAAAAAPLAGWLDQAQALIDARAALADMAAHA